MKIGILSMQRIFNYGSFMQSYSLKKMVESLGHEVVFIDIKPGRQLESGTYRKFDRIKSILSKLDKNILKRLEDRRQDKKIAAIFTKILKDELGVDQWNEDEPCDIVIVGSDEVFNCTQLNASFGFSTHLFGKGVNAKKVISYAASFGHTCMSDLDRYGITSEVKENLKNFSIISVRDKNSAAIVEQFTGIAPLEHVDPVVVGEFDQRIPAPPIKDYIAVYAYGNRINREEEISAIRAFAKKHNKKIVCVGMYQMWCDTNVVGTPFEMVGYIKHADYVITDTFHGCVFSIKYQKQFVAFVRDSNRNKLTDLLERFALSSRMVASPEKLEETIMPQIDVEYIKIRIQEEHLRSVDYLTKNLK